MAADTAAPTTELGTSQRTASWAGPMVDETERNPELVGNRLPQTHALQLNDAHIEGLYRGLTYPIRAFQWYLDPNGAPPATVERISKDYGLPVGPDGVMNQRRAQRRFRFDKHLEDALRSIAYGHYFFEQVGEIGPDGFWHLRKLAPRPPRTIMEIKPARDGGLDHIKVPALNPRRNGLAFLTPGIELPVERLLAYVWDQEGSNWRGRSMLRSLYGPWKRKFRVMNVGAINIERAGGVPYIEAPEGATKGQMEDLHALAAAFRVGESAGAALPHGATLKFAQAAGGDAAVNYVRLQNEEMSRAWVQMVNVLGQTATGSRALGETFQDRAGLVERTVAGFICDVFNEHMIEDDVEWNDGPDQEYAPLLAFTATGNPVDEMANALDDAQVAGVLPADSPTAALVRGDARPAALRRRPQPTAATPADDGLPDAIKNAGVDFEALQATYVASVARLRRQWTAITATQIDALVDQITAATTVEDLATITIPAAGADVLLAELTEVMHDGAGAAEAEAIHQGATLPAPDLDTAGKLVEMRANATAELLASSLAQSAASRAVSLAGSVTGADLAADVRAHLEGLAGRARDYELAGAVTHAQNEGRFAVMDQAPEATRFYSSEINDSNTCGPCDDVDGEEYESMSELRRDYGAGHYVGCEGGNLCRGTGVAVYPED